MPGAATSAPSQAQQKAAARAYGKLPLAFVPNAGQTDHSVSYYAQGAGYTFYFTHHKAVLALQKGDRGQALDLRFVGANPNPKLVAADRASGRVNYLRGSQHQTGLPTYGQLVYRDLWPGIDMVFGGRGGKLNYEFRLRPGAKPSDIRLAYAGAEGVSLGAGGTLQIHTPLGTLKDARPQSFQRIDGRRVPVDSRYALAGSSYGFAIGHHDRGQPLVIDPSLAYSTYLGGSNFDEGLGIAVDSAGAAYVTGQTASTDFPTTAGAFDTSFNGGNNSSFNSDAFVTKLNPAGSGLAYSTYLGGSGDDQGLGIAVDSAGAAYVTGQTRSTDFPTTAGAFDSSYNGGFYDAFVTKLDPAGQNLAYSTYLGGSDLDQGLGIAVDSAGAAYVTGYTVSTDFPTSAGAFATSANGGYDAFVTKLNPLGSSPLAYSTYLGGSNFDFGQGIAVDSLGAAYVTGQTDSSDFPTTAGAFDTSANGNRDAFVTKLDPAGQNLAYSTYLGGSDVDQGHGIAVDSSGAAYVTGETDSTDFPTTAGAFDSSFNGGAGGDAFVTKLNPTGSGLAYSTYLGGSYVDGGYDSGYGIAVDSLGAAYVTGYTTSTNFPTTAGAFDTSLNSGDAFVSKLDPAGQSLAYSTYLGGSSFDFGQGIAVDSSGAAYVTGRTASTDFPTTAGAFDTSYNGGNGGSYDAFVTKLTSAQATISTTVKDSAATTVDNANPAALGTAVHDTATLSGQVGSLSFDGTATVTYSFFTNNGCSGTADSTENVTVSAGGAVPNSAAQTLGAGSYSYRATYNGNSNYDTATSDCEPFKVAEATPEGKISARGTVETEQGPSLGFSAANDCNPTLSTRPSIVATIGGGRIWTKSSVTDSSCTDQPPTSSLGFDTQTGTATGTFGAAAPGGRGGQMGTLQWIYFDSGPDSVQFTLRDSSNTIVYQVDPQRPTAYFSSSGGVWTFPP